jgi:hypothetical protein
MGFVKLSNFKENSQKTKYSYLLTPKGIREKSLITSKFLVRKKQELRLLSCSQIPTLPCVYHFSMN